AASGRSSRSYGTARASRRWPVGAGWLPAWHAQPTLGAQRLGRTKPPPVSAVPEPWGTDHLLLRPRGWLRNRGKGPPRAPRAQGDMRRGNWSSRPARSSSQAVRQGRPPLPAGRVPEPDPRSGYGPDPGWFSPGTSGRRRPSVPQYAAPPRNP